MIKSSRLFVNFIFFNLYWLIASIIFSFVFPIVLKVFWRPVLNSVDPVFDKIQISIIIFILVISIVFRKYFYLPIRSANLEEKTIETKKELELEHDLNILKQKDERALEVKQEERTQIKEEKKQVLDIKIGREIK